MLKTLRRFKKKPENIVSNTLTGAKKKNNTWYHYNADSEIIIVFVHGFLSNSESCWTSKSGKYWPDIIREDARFGNPTLFLGGYHTAYDSGDYNLWDCAKELIDALEREDPQGLPSPLSCQNILFVCHSLGGIVTRYMLEANTHKFNLKNIGLALMASPSIGSEYADTFLGIINFYKNGIARQLTNMNDTLRDLDIKFRTLIEEKRIPFLVGAEAIEHRSPIKIFFLPKMPLLVTKNSASRYFALSRTLPETTHSSIVKPDSNNDPSHLFLIDFYVKKFIPQIDVRSKIQSSETHATPLGNRPIPIFIPSSLESQVLFDIYSPNSALYYSMRKIDDDIRSTASLYSVWLSGPSGCGKTSAVLHMLHELGHKPLDVCLSSCYGELTPERMITEIATTAYQLKGTGQKPEQTFPGLVAALAEHFKQSTIILYLDEVPIKENDTKTIEIFVNFIARLLESVKRLTGNTDARFIVSSIVAPTIATGNPGKFAEHMRSLPMSLWSIDELDHLLCKILLYIILDDFGENKKRELLESTKGSPRFLKMYIKNRLLFPEIGHAETLAITSNQNII